MAIDAALVGTRGTSSSNTVTTTAGTSTGGSGNHGLIVVSYDPGQTISTVSDSKSNTWTIIGSVQSDASEGRMAIYRSYDWTGGASHTATVTFSGTAFPTLHLIEITGADSASPLDIDVPETDTAQPCSAATGTLAQADEVVIVAGCCNEIAGDGAYTSTSATILSSESAVSSFWTSGVAKVVVASTTTTNQDIRRNAPTTSGGGHIRLVSFKQSTGGGGGVNNSLAWITA